MQNLIPKRSIILPDGFVPFLHNLGYDLTESNMAGTNKKQELFDRGTWGTYRSKKETVMSVLYQHFKSDLQDKGVSLHKSAQIIVIDYDGDHDSLSFSNTQERLNYSNYFYQMICNYFQTTPIFLERKDSGNFHAFFKTEKSYFNQELSKLEKELKKKFNLKAFDIIKKGSKVLRLVGNAMYSPVNVVTLQKTNKFEINDSAPISHKIIYDTIYDKNVSKKVFMHKNLNTNSISFSGFEFNKGQRSAQWFVSGFGFAIARKLNFDKDAIKEWILEHAGTSDDLNNSSKAEATAEDMAIWVIKYYKEGEMEVNYSTASGSKVYTNHLDNLTEENKTMISHISDIFVNNYGYHTKNKRKQEYKRAAALTLEWIFSSIDFFNDDYERKINSKCALGPTKQKILQKSFAIYQKQIKQYLKTQGITSIDCRRLLKDLEEFLLISGVIEKTLDACSFAYLKYKRQFKSNVKNILDNLGKLLNHIFKGFSKSVSFINNRNSEFIGYMLTSFSDIKDDFINELQNILTNEPKIDNLQEKTPTKDDFDDDFLQNLKLQIN